MSSKSGGAKRSRNGGDGQVVAEERLLPGALGRIRFVVEGPDGAVYVGSDTGEIIRLTRAED